jgi:acetyltransferase-like isoleucine patch superfamily enzyme
MGGVIIIAATVIPTLLFAPLTNRFVVVSMVAMLWCGAIGFIDDYLKVVEGRPRGLVAKWKLIGRGIGIHWPALDEDVSVEGLLAGKASGESQSSLAKWLKRKKSRRTPPSAGRAAVLRLHRERKAKATIVLTPVENPAAYGLVETDADGNVKRFLEKPKTEDITCDTINAGVYVLEPETFDRIPKDAAWSIERSYFPSLTERAETFVAYIYRGYWIDIGTPEKYVQVHRDIMDRRFLAEPFGSHPRGATAIAATARIEDGARIEGPCFIDEGTVVKAGAQVRPYSVIGRNSVIEEDAVVDGAIIWPNGRISRNARVTRSILGRHCHVGRDAVIEAGNMLGDKSAVTDFSRLTATL